MDSKQSTLRSQTVQCPNCGENYSVTYKYCPFCEYGKPEERKLGAKVKSSGLLGGLLGGSEPQKKTDRPRKRPAETARRRSEEAGTEETPRKRTAGQSRKRPDGEEGAAKKSAAMSSYAAWYSSPEYEATRKRSGGPRKKTSEMTPEEKAANRAEREARAAERKRERERLSRAVGAETLNPKPALLPEEDRPTESVVLPETVPVSAPVTPEPVPVKPAPAAAEPKPIQAEPDPAALENIPLYIPEGMPEMAPAAAVSEGVMAPEAEGGAESVVLENIPPVQTEQPVQVEQPIPAEQPVAPEEQPVMEPVEQPAQAGPGTPEGDLDALLREIRGMLYGVEETPAEEPAPEEPAQPLVQEAPLTAGELLAKPEELTIDQIMEEVRNGLLDMPAGAERVQPAPQPETAGDAATIPAENIAPVQEQPAAEPQQAEEEIPQPAAEPAQPQPMAEPIPAEQPVPPAEASPAAETVQPVEEQPQPVAAEPQPVVEEQPQPAAEQAEEPVRPAVEPAPEAEEENPFLKLSEEKPETDPALEKVFGTAEPAQTPAEPEILAVSLGRRTPEPAPEAPKPKKKAKKAAPGKKSKMPILLLISLVVIIVAIFIICHSVVPAFRDGVLSGGEAQAEVVEDTATSFTFDQTELNFVEPQAKVTLIPVFEPEGSAATLSWACSNWSVAYLDADGTVTSLAPGDAVITATMANGQTAECQVHCAWDADTAAAQQAEGDSASKSSSNGPALSSNDISLGEAGASKTLEVTGTSEKPVWASSNTAVATVDQNGVVTAVAKGSASVTAEVGDKTLTCAVRCVW